jgi:hypothetical protein
MRPTSNRRPRTANERSLARYARAAKVLPPVTLDADQAAALKRILRCTGESYASWVRRHVDEGT